MHPDVLGQGLIPAKKPGNCTADGAGCKQLCLQFGDVGWALVGVHGQAPHNRPFGLGGNAGIEASGCGKRPWFEKTCLGVQWRLSGQQVVEGRGQRIDIGSGIGVPCIATILLQRGVLDGPTTLDNRDGPLVVRDQDLNEAKVDKLDIA